MARINVEAMPDGNSVNVQVVPQARQVVNINRGVAGPRGPQGPQGEQGIQGISFTQLDGGFANSTYGGVTPIDCGGA